MIKFKFGFNFLNKILAAFVGLSLSVSAFADGSFFGGDSSSGSGGAAHSNPILQFLPIIVLVVLLYFFLIRPQMKQSKEQRNLLGNLQVGDEVHTQAGLIGKVTKVGEQYVSLNIAENTEIKMVKKAITGVVPKGTLKNI